jgi:Nuclease-related domain
VTGEELVATVLGRALGDDWTLLRGYRNRRGEIDHVLLGPRGVFAIEVKHRNATVYVTGDSWRFGKYDRYGNLVERGWITDRRGRSPSAQLNEPAGELERFLRSRGQPVTLQRIVVLTHPRSRLDSAMNLTVDAVIDSPGDVVGHVTRGAAALSSPQLAQLEQLIIRDHNHHEARRPAR